MSKTLNKLPGVKSEFFRNLRKDSTCVMDMKNNIQESRLTSRNHVLLVVILISLYRLADAVCKIPEHFLGDYYSIDHGIELRTLINEKSMTNDALQTAYCEQYEVIDGTEDAQGRYDIRLIVHNEDADCYHCFQMHHRTVNVVQYLQTSCISRGTIEPDLKSLCAQIQPHTDTYTMFRIAVKTVNCRETFEGTYQFTYEVDFGGGGICDSPNSTISACQEPGSVYTDNQVFRMRFGKCVEVPSSADTDIRFMCMGSWIDDRGNIYSAMADIGRDQYRERFRCMLTRRDQELDNSLRFALSRWASCSSLKSPYEGPIRLLLKPVLSGRQLVAPTCVLPRNFTGSWINSGEYDNYIDINRTHLHFKTGYSMYTYRETIFTCIMHRDQRYLVQAVSIGKCEIDYMCFHFLPRHHNIIRWRLSKPISANALRGSRQENLEKAFRQVCTWSAFTYDSQSTDWMYRYFLLNPPAPYPCPIQGRYAFTQHGLPEELYRTRVRGITERPRHNLDCKQYTSELKSCPNNPTKIFVDVEYCATLDHTGKPIGEYEIADHEITCVGYWQENMKSYLITYDYEDPVSSFRCWVYERSDWRTIAMMRSSSALCSSNQTAWTNKWEQWASLQLRLTESERLYDSCPQNYDTGTDPWAKEAKIYVFNTALHSANSALLTYFLAACATAMVATALCCLCNRFKSAICATVA